MDFPGAVRPGLCGFAILDFLNLAGAGYKILVEEQAIFFPPLNSARLLNCLRRFEGVGQRLLPGAAAFLAVAGSRAKVSDG